MTPQEIQSQLNNFTGSAQFTRWSPMFNRHVLTEGTLWLAEEANAYWLMDLIASHQSNKTVASEVFQSWTLTKNKSGNGAMVVATDGNDNQIAQQKLDYTDFPLDEICLWAERNELGGVTILIPSEH